MCREVGDAEAKPALRPLKELVREFRERLNKQPAEALQTGILKKLVEGKGFGFIVPDGGSKDVFLHFSDLVNGGSEDMVVGMRVSYTNEVDPKSGKTRARNAAIVESGLEVHGGSAPRAVARHALSTSTRSAWEVEEIKGEEEPQALYTYGRQELLTCCQRLREAHQDTRMSDFCIQTVHVPHADARRPGHSFAEDPSLDDEDLIIEMEDRLSRESGADAKNVETFGECLGGWTFEEALEANARLPFCAFAMQQPAGKSPLAFFAEEECARETSPLVTHALRRHMYWAVALQLMPDKELEHCYSPFSSSTDLDHGLSTAASSGAATPCSGSMLNHKDLSKDFWGNEVVTRYQ